MAVAECVELIGEHVEPESAHEVYVDNWRVWRCFYANEYEGVVRTRMSDGTVSEIRGRVEIVPVEREVTRWPSAHAEPSNN